MPPVPVLTARQVIAVLERRGFRRTGQTGSHLRLRDDHGHRVSVPVHRGRTLPKGTLRNIIRQSGLDIEAFDR